MRLFVLRAAWCVKYRLITLVEGPALLKLRRARDTPLARPLTSHGPKGGQSEKHDKNCESEADGAADLDAGLGGRHPI